MPRQLLVSLPANKNIQVFAGALEEADFEVELAESGFAVVRHLEVHRPDLVILDVALPDVSGIEVCRHIRRRSLANHVPVVLLSAAVNAADEIAAFEAGADDYIPSSTSIRLLVHRILARLRRSRPQDSNDIDENISLDPATRVVTINGEDVQMTPSEFRLLEVLIARRNELVTRNHLLVLAAFRSANTRTIDVHIRALRRKLGKFGRRIETVRTQGYRFIG